MLDKDYEKNTRDMSPPRRTGTWRAVIKAVLVRSVLLLHSLLTVWRTATVLDNNMFWLLAVVNVTLAIDGIYCVVVLKGQERKWFCPCFFFYLLSTLPGLWVLELNRFNLFDDILKNNNVTQTTNQLNEIDGITLPIKLDNDTWVQVLEQSLLFLLILGRWLLPRGPLTRDQLSQLLFVYIGSASDVMELLVIFEEPEIRDDRALTLAIFVVWTISLLQFTLVLTATRSAKRLKAVESEGDAEFKHKHGAGCCGCRRLFELEVWSLIISIFLMDGPFFAVRLYALIVHQLVAYGIIFFALKNFMIIALTCYRVVIVCSKLYCDDEDSVSVIPLSQRKLSSTKRGRPNSREVNSRERLKRGSSREKENIEDFIHNDYGYTHNERPSSRFSHASGMGNGDERRSPPRYSNEDEEGYRRTPNRDRGFLSYNNRVADSYGQSYNSPF